MGYYTEHSLEIIGGDIDITIAVNEIQEISGYSDLFEGSEVKWYEHKENMKVISKKYPDSIFKLSGIGEEQPDLWVEYHQNGKFQRCNGVITYPPFNKSKLR